MRALALLIAAVALTGCTSDMPVDDGGAADTTTATVTPTSAEPSTSSSPPDSTSSSSTSTVAPGDESPQYDDGGVLTVHLAAPDGWLLAAAHDPDAVGCEGTFGVHTVRLGPAGEVEPGLAEAGNTISYPFIEVSPDGSRVLLWEVCEGYLSGVFVADLEPQAQLANLRSIETEGFEGGRAGWTPDGQIRLDLTANTFDSDSPVLAFEVDPDTLEQTQVEEYFGLNFRSRQIDEGVFVETIFDSDGQRVVYGPHASEAFRTWESVDAEVSPDRQRIATWSPIVPGPDADASGPITVDGLFATGSTTIDLRSGWGLKWTADSAGLLVPTVDGVVAVSVDSGAQQSLGRTHALSPACGEWAAVPTIPMASTSDGLVLLGHTDCETTSDQGPVVQYTLEAVRLS